MTDWTDGYVSGVDYTFGYYGDLNPVQHRLALLASGLQCPAVHTACELGFGQGVSLNLHAAATGVQWWGTDFNPAQASFAAQVSAAAGSGAHIFDDSFAQFCSRPELPQFDLIALHGIWSWINDANRQVIVDFVRRKLRVGGMLYVSYNTLPGWSSMAPLRHLATQHADVMGSQGQGILGRVKGAFDFLEALETTQPLFWQANPQVQQRFARLRLQDPSYLAHEYFNRDWHPLYFADMAHWLEPAKLSFACTAAYLGLVDDVNLTPAQATLLRAQPAGEFRETVRDFMVNQQFRRDLWVKGPQALTSAEKREQLRDHCVVLIRPRGEIDYALKGTQVGGSLQEPLYEPLIELLADHRPHRLGDLELQLREHHIHLGQLVQMAIVLIGKGDAASAQAEREVSAARPTSRRLNEHLVAMACVHGDVQYLSSPVTGGGIQVQRLYQQFTHARRSGCADALAGAKFVWRILQSEGKALKVKNRLLETEPENLEELMRRHEHFTVHTLPLLQALDVCD